MIVAIDGPAGAGKSTVSGILASRLGFLRIDTGALYRAVALAAREAGVAPEDGPGLATLVEGLRLDYRDGLLHLDGAPLTDTIRTEEISRLASAYAGAPAVRSGLLELQRRLGRAQDSVLDGRDIGTVVFPDADVKIYLTASVAERARRRAAELRARGEPASLDAIRADIEARDHADSTRAVAPLRKADDAVEVDVTDLDIDGAVAACLAVVAPPR